MQKKDNTSYLFKIRTYPILVLFFVVSACTTKTTEPSIALSDMPCAQLLPAIDSTNLELNNAQKEISQSMDVRTGGVVSAQGGSSSGVGIGVGISLGAPLNTYHKRKAVAKAQTLKQDLLNLQNEAIAKKCYQK